MQRISFLLGHDRLPSA